MAEKRDLTAAETKRLEEFEAMASDLESEGYKRTTLTISISRANIVSILFLIPLFIVGALLYYLFNGHLYWVNTFTGSLLFIAALVVMIVLHELIHGVTWAIYAEHHFHDIAFGIMKKFLTPYCTCKTPLPKIPYVLGALMPLLLLGIVPFVIAIFMDQFIVMIVGIVMITAATGDILIVHKVLGHKSDAEEIIYVDHPTEAGGVIFER